MDIYYQKELHAFLLINYTLYIFPLTDLSDDSYGTVVNMSMDQDGSSPHSGIGRPSFLHGTTSPSYLPGHTPPHGHEHFSPYPDHLSVYASLGKLHFLIFNVFCFIR